MRKRREIPIERVRSVLRYEPESGKFFWKEKIADKIIVGREAGNSTGRRDIRISIDGVLYQGHRLAWAIMTGEQPPDLIDHCDLDTRNNRWGNLRAADTASNGANRKAQANGATGSKGVHYYPARKSPWLARLSVRGEIKLNRYYGSREQAEDAYAMAAAKYCGEFARS